MQYNYIILPGPPFVHTNTWHLPLNLDTRNKKKPPYLVTQTLTEANPGFWSKRKTHLRITLNYTFKDGRHRCWLNVWYLLHYNAVIVREFKSRQRRKSVFPPWPLLTSVRNPTMINLINPFIYIYIIQYMSSVISVHTPKPTQNFYYRFDHVKRYEIGR